MQKQMDNRKQCPHCSRMFNDDAAQRHFPICARNAESSKLMVVRDAPKATKMPVAAKTQARAPLPVSGRKIAKQLTPTSV